MSATYLLINAFILAIPLALTFDRRTAYYRRLPAVAYSITIVSTSYLVWDVVVTAQGEWSFNRKYLLGVQLGNIPLEEVLFFLTVPYSCLFIYEALAYKIKPASLKIPGGCLIALTVLLLGASVALRHQGYTSKAFASCAVFFALAAFLDRPLLRSRHYWIWIAICYLPFFLINSILTALPVVEYNPAAIFGFRVLTIPIEDFFYNFSMLSFYLLFYRMRRRAE